MKDKRTHAKILEIRTEIYSMVTDELEKNPKAMDTTQDTIEKFHKLGELSGMTIAIGVLDQHLAKIE